MADLPNGDLKSELILAGGSRFTDEIPVLDTPPKTQAKTAAMIDHTSAVSGNEISEYASEYASEEEILDLSSIVEALEKFSRTGSAVTDFSEINIDTGTAAVTAGLPPFVTMMLGAVTAAAIAFAVLAVGKNKKK